MKMNHIAAAVVVSISCALVNVSCVQSGTATPEAASAGGGAPALETKDDGDPFGSDPGLGGGIGSERPVIHVGTDPSSTDVGSGPPSTSAQSGSGGSAAQPEGRFTYNVCALLKNACANVRSAFCISQPDPAVRAKCRSHLFDSPVSWQNYCYNEFYDE